MHLKAVREGYCSLFEKKLSLSKKILSAVEKYKTNKDRASFKSVKNQIDSERKQINKKDRKYLIEMYEHLDVEYKVKNDLKENEMFDTIEDFSKNIKLPCSVIFVSISTHGKDNGGLMGIEGRSVSVGEIVKCFEKKELLGIPKIFIIQACKGIAKEERECEGDGTHSDSTIPTQYCTKRADVLIAYSTSEGCLSYRNTENGSWFIEVLKDCVTNGRYDSKHLVEILTICTNKIVNDYCDGNRTQTPSYYSTLMKFLKFEKRGKASKT